nr:MAG: hypothetical protein BECKTC1821E_GA0114239_10042 [Candidatus Kentron sp. TC]
MDGTQELTKALGHFGKKLPADQAKIISLRLETAMRNNTNPVMLARLGEALSNFGEKLPTSQAKAAALRLEMAMEKNSNLWSLSRLGAALASLCERLPVEQSKLIALRLEATLEASLDKIDNPSHREQVVKALISLQWELPADVVRESALSLIEKMRENYSVAMKVDYGKELLTLGGKLSADLARIGASQLVAAMGKTTDSSYLHQLRKIVGGLGKGLPPRMAPKQSPRS